MPTLAQPIPIRPESRPYTPHGAARDLWACRADEVLLSGPAGTGKSRACLEKLHFCAEKYAGMRGLIVRKTRASLTESALVTFESLVLPAGHVALGGASRRLRQAYSYANGSSIVVAGLDVPGKVMSTEFDLIFVQEAIELNEEDWESLTTRLRHGKMPYQQLIADTNPSAPSHWLLQRCRAGKARYLDSRHEDNPLLWNSSLEQWTEFGRQYIQRLEALTGPRKDRLRHGRWVQAEGMVYDTWDPRLHMLPMPRSIPESWTRYWVVDFGYVDPFVCQWWARDEDGRLYRYREIYRTGRLVEDHARKMLELSRSEPRPQAVICDHDAEGVATLRKYLGLPLVPARKELMTGMQAVTARLRVAGDGKPRLLLYSDALVERDRDLVEAKKPCCTEEEIEGYVWDTAAGRRRGEVPVDRDNHGMDCLRYLVMHVDSGAVQKTIGFRPFAVH